MRSLVDDIGNEASDNGNQVVRESFYEKLGDYGWHPEQRDRLFLVDEGLMGFFDVREGFPRITTATFEQGQIDERLSINTYSLTMSGIDGFSVDLEPGMSGHEILQALLASRD